MPFRSKRARLRKRKQCVLSYFSASGRREENYEPRGERSEEHTSELQSPCNLVCRLLLEKKKNTRLTQRTDALGAALQGHEPHLAAPPEAATFTPSTLVRRPTTPRRPASDTRAPYARHRY